MSSPPRESRPPSRDRTPPARDKSHSPREESSSQREESSSHKEGILLPEIGVLSGRDVEMHPKTNQKPMDCIAIKHPLLRGGRNSCRPI